MCYIRFCEFKMEYHRVYYMTRLSSPPCLLRMSPLSQSAENNFWFCVLMCPRCLMSCAGQHLPLLRIITHIHCLILERILLKTQLHWSAIVWNEICRVLFWSPAWQQHRHFQSLLLASIPSCVSLLWSQM